MILYLVNLVLNKVLFLIHVYLFQCYRKSKFSPNHPCSPEHFPHLSVTGNWIWGCLPELSFVSKKTGMDEIEPDSRKRKKTAFITADLDKLKKAYTSFCFDKRNPLIAVMQCSVRIRRMSRNQLYSKWDLYILQPSSAQQLNDILHRTWLCSMRYPLEVAFWKGCCSSWWRKV